jgi:signal transduction histidine kinase
VSLARRAHPRDGSNCDVELCPENAAVDAALTAWRRKAANVLLIAVAIAYLPIILAEMFGYGSAMGLVVKAIVTAIYLVIAATALFRRVEYRLRLQVAFFAAYVSLAVANVIYPRGPYAQAGVATMPIFVLVLLGVPAARRAVLASVGIVLLAPLLRLQPDAVRVLAIDPAQVALPPGAGWMQIAAETAILFTLMVLLDRFHNFFLETLTARMAAQQTMEHEMGERQRLEREISAIGDGERRRLGLELHDGACQQLTAALLHCQVLRRRLQSGEALLDDDFQAISSLLSDGIGEARNIARGLCPLDPDPEALAPALRALTKRIREMGTARCEFVAAGDVRVPDPAMAQHLYRIAQEALSNAVRHARANRIVIELRRSDSELILLVEDDGAGLPQELPAGGMGLRTMAYRAHIMAGELTVAPAPHGGIRITCRVPVPAETLAAGRHA